MEESEVKEPAIQPEVSGTSVGSVERQRSGSARSRMRAAIKKVVTVNAKERCFELLKEAMVESCLFYEFSYADLKYLAEELCILRLERHAYVTKRGDQSGFLVIILEGTCEVKDAGGNKIGEMGIGDVAGELSLFTGEPRKADVTVSSIAGAFIVALEYDAIQKIYLDNPELGLRLMRILSRVTRHHAMIIGCAKLGPENSFPAIEKDAPAKKALKFQQEMKELLLEVHEERKGLGRAMTPSDMELLVDKAQWWSVRKGEKVFQKGRRGASVLFLLEGKMSVRAKDESDLFSLGRGALIGARPFLMLESSPHSLRDHDVVALEDTTLAVFPREMLEHLGAERCELAHKFYMHLVSKCVTIEDRPLIQKHKSFGFPESPPLRYDPVSEPDVKQSETPEIEGNGDEDDDNNSTSQKISQEQVYDMIMFCRAYTRWMDEITQHEAQKLSAMMQIFTVDEGSPIICSLWEANAIHILLAGKAEMTGATRDGLELEVGHWLGELEWCEPGRKWNSNIRALQSGTVVGVFTVEALGRLHTYDHVLALKMIRLACNCCWLSFPDYLHEPVQLRSRLKMIEHSGKVLTQYRQHIHKFFDPNFFDDEALEQITNSMSMAKMAAYETLVKAGEQLQAFIIVLGGSVESVEQTSVEMTYRPGDVLAPHSILAEEAVVFEHRSGGIGALLLIMPYQDLKNKLLVDEEMAHYAYEIIFALIARQIQEVIAGAAVPKRTKKQQVEKEGIMKHVEPRAKPRKRRTSGIQSNEDMPEVKLDDSVRLTEKVNALMAAQLQSVYWRMLNYDEMKLVAKNFNVISVKAASKLAKKGEPAQFMGLILSGCATAFHDRQEVKTYQVGEMFGVQNFLMGNFEHGGRAMDITADEDCTVGVFMFRKMKEFVVSEKVAGMKLVKLLSHMALHQLQTYKADYHIELEDARQSSAISQSSDFKHEDKVSYLNQFFLKHKAKWCPTSRDTTAPQFQEEVSNCLARIVDVVKVSPGETVINWQEKRFCLFMVLEGEVNEMRKFTSDKMGVVDKDKSDVCKFTGQRAQARTAGDYIGEGIICQRLYQLQDLHEAFDWDCNQGGPATLIVLEIKDMLDNLRYLPRFYSKLQKDLGSVLMKKLWNTYQCNYDVNMEDGELDRNVEMDVKAKMLRGLTFGTAKLNFQRWSPDMNHYEKLELLKRLSEASRFWFGFTDEELETLSNLVEYSEYKSGEYFSRITDTVHSAGIVARGKLEVMFASNDEASKSSQSSDKGSVLEDEEEEEEENRESGNEEQLSVEGATVIAEIFPGNLVGHLSMFQGGVRNVNMVSRSDETVVLRIPPAQLDMLVEEEPQLAHKIISCFLKSAISLVKESSLDIQERFSRPAYSVARDKLYKMMDKALKANAAAFGSYFNPSEIYKILDFMFISRTKYGQGVYLKGDEGLDLAFILDGVVELRVDDSMWKHHGMAWRKDGEWIGEVSSVDCYMTRLTRTATLGTGSPFLYLGVMSNNEFNNLCDKLPSIAYRLVHMFASSLVNTKRDELIQILKESGASEARQAWMDFPGEVDPDAASLESLLKLNNKAHLKVGAKPPPQAPPQAVWKPSGNKLEEKKVERPPSPPPPPPPKPVEVEEKPLVLPVYHAVVPAFRPPKKIEAPRQPDPNLKQRSRYLEYENYLTDKWNAENLREQRAVSNPTRMYPWEVNNMRYSHNATLIINGKRGLREEQPAIHDQPQNMTVYQQEFVNHSIWKNAQDQGFQSYSMDSNQYLSVSQSCQNIGVTYVSPTVPPTPSKAYPASPRGNRRQYSSSVASPQNAVRRPQSALQSGRGSFISGPTSRPPSGRNSADSPFARALQIEQMAATLRDSSSFSTDSAPLFGNFGTMSASSIPGYTSLPDTPDRSHTGRKSSLPYIGTRMYGDSSNPQMFRDYQSVKIVPDNIARYSRMNKNNSGKKK